MKFEYFYGSQAEQFSFYRIPRLLIKDKRFKKLSSDAKILYGLMLDRVSLSMRNGWIDGKGRAYIYFTIEDIMDELCCSKPTAVKILAELDAKKGIGLVEKKKQGLGRPDIIYVMDFTSGKDDEKERRSTETVTEVKNLNFSKSDSLTSDSKEEKTAEVNNFNFSKSTNYTLRGKGDEPAKVNVIDPNYNDLSYNENSQTENIHLSISHSEEKDVTDREDASGYMALIRKNIEYEHYMRAGAPGDKELVDELYQLICDVVCVKRNFIRIGGEDYPYEVVKSRLLKLRQPHIEYVMDAMRKTTSKIHDIRSYLITALYRAPETINHYYRQEVNHDFYGGVE